MSDSCKDNDLMCEIPELGLDLSKIAYKAFNDGLGENVEYTKIDSISCNKREGSCDVSTSTPAKKQKSVSSLLAGATLFESEATELNDSVSGYICELDSDDDNDTSTVNLSTPPYNRIVTSTPNQRQRFSPQRSHFDDGLDEVHYRNMIHAVTNRSDITRRNLDQRRLLNSADTGVDHSLMADIDNQNVGSFQDIVKGADIVRATYNIRDKDLYDVHRNEILKALKIIHESLSTRPAASDLEETPSRLKIPLLPHQRHALSFMKWRENLKPSGGILADDMGLGKTLTIISLIIDKFNSSEKLEKPMSCRMNLRATLIVCPTSIISQWQKEIETQIVGGVRLMIHHKESKGRQWRDFLNYDIVITTYGYVMNDFKQTGPLFQIYWTRVVLDEAHIIRNSKTQSSEACCALNSKYRWLLTGTPIHNKEEDLFPLFKFLKLKPFNDWKVFNHWAKGSDAYARIQVLMKALLLRRTKIDLHVNSNLQLPEKFIETFDYELDRREMAVYQQLLVFCQTLLVMFLNQRAIRTGVGQIYDKRDRNQMAEFERIRSKLLENNHNKVHSHEILVFFLRLRQMCCHPYLSKAVSDIIIFLYFR